MWKDSFEEMFIKNITFHLLWEQLMQKLRLVVPLDFNQMIN